MTTGPCSKTPVLIAHRISSKKKCVTRGDVRRAKLYYLRERSLKAANGTAATRVSVLAVSFGTAAFTAHLTRRAAPGELGYTAPTIATDSDTNTSWGDGALIGPDDVSAVLAKELSCRVLGRCARVGRTSNRYVSPACVSVRRSRNLLQGCRSHGDLQVRQLVSLAINLL